VEPAKLSKSDNHQQEPRGIATSAAHRQLYFEGFGNTTPDNVVSIEERCRVEGCKEKRGVPRSGSVQWTAHEARCATSAMLWRRLLRC
jgi:hypothetical protein